MKRLLIVRFPKTVNPESAEFQVDKIKSAVSDMFIVLFVGDNVDKTEFEIVYDPHFRAEEFEQSTVSMRAFTQVDTSTNAHMEGKP